jgi:hypothetical protein
MSRRHTDRWTGILPAILLLAAVILVSGVIQVLPGSGADRAIGASPPPTVTSASPVDGAENCPLDQVFRVSFDQDMDQTTLVPGALYILKGSGMPLPATVSYDAATRTATLSPLAKLEAGSAYYVALSVTVKSSTGAGVAGAPLLWHFHTVEPIPPHIAGRTPADGSTGQPLTSVISVTFDTPMDAGTFTSSSFYYAKQGGYPLPATISYDSATMTATLTPAAPIEEATTYQVTLTSAVRGVTGTFVVGTPVVWSFTTILVQPPAVTGLTPADGAQEQPVDVMVMISFDREMDRNTVNPDSFYIQKVGGEPLPSVLTCNGNAATLTPEIHLDPDTTYKVTVTGAVKNVKGASVIGAPITWTFKTKQMPLPFSDVPVSHPYFTAILQLAEREIIGGFGGGLFRPEIPVTRQQFAKMIVLALGYHPSEDSTSPFTDVTRTDAGHLVDAADPYYPDHYVAVAVAHGIVMGETSTIFAPYKNISRFQAVTMVVRAIDDIDRGLLKNPPATYEPTWNPSLSPDHGQNARLAEFNGLLAQLPWATLDPSAPMSRGEIAQLEWNLVKFLKL